MGILSVDVTSTTLCHSGSYMCVTLGFFLVVLEASRGKQGFQNSAQCLSPPCRRTTTALSPSVSDFSLHTHAQTYTHTHCHRRQQCQQLILMHLNPYPCSSWIGAWVYLWVKKCVSMYVSFWGIITVSRVDSARVHDRSQTGNKHSSKYPIAFTGISQHFAIFESHICTVQDASVDIMYNNIRKLWYKHIYSGIVLSYCITRKAGTLGCSITWFICKRAQQLC